MNGLEKVGITTQLAKIIDDLTEIQNADNVSDDYKVRAMIPRVRSDVARLRDEVQAS